MLNFFVISWINYYELELFLVQNAWIHIINHQKKNEEREEQSTFRERKMKTFYREKNETFFISIFIFGFSFKMRLTYMCHVSVVRNILLKFSSLQASGMETMHPWKEGGYFDLWVSWHTSNLRSTPNQGSN